MRILCVVNGAYGERIASFLSQASPPGWDVLSWRGPVRLPVLLDEPEGHLPDSLPRVDLLISLAESPGLADLAPELAVLCGAEAVILPVDRYSWLPVGLAGQIARRCRERGLGFASPSPFCSLSSRPDGHPLINAFAVRFGSPDLHCEVAAGRVVSVGLDREAPCGNTQFVADRLVGVSVGDAVERASLLHHYYPCLAGMELAASNSHTLLHRAAKMTGAAVSRALGHSTVTDPARASTSGEENEHAFACLSGDVER